ncbi:MAG: gliding motility-associated C-terminal domain-containing protein [Bacteroidota bacterium]
MKHLLLSSLAAIFVTIQLWAQPTICGPGAEMAPDCAGACVICDIDGFTGNNEGTQGGTAPPGYCTFAIHHMEWIGFIAGTPNLSLEIFVSNCNNGPGNGLEAGIYEGIDCGNFSLVSNCETAIFNNTSVILTNTIPLVVGQYYWLVMDSNGGNACDFSVSVVGGSTSVPPLSPIPAINGPGSTCPGGTLSFSIDPVVGASEVNWTVDGMPAGSGENVDVMFPNAGAVQLCVEASNVCHPPVSLCTTIDVVPIPPTEVSETICFGDCFVAESGDEFCIDGVFPVIYLSADGCDSLVNYTIETIPEPFIQVEAIICEGETYTVGNEEFSMPGVYTVNLTGALGCDSFVVLNLFFEIIPETEIVDEICDGEVYLLGTETFTETGVYTLVYLSNLGCDSTVLLDLTVHELDSIYLTESICQGDSVMVGSSVFYHAGSYEVVLENIIGCDSSVFLDLAVTALPETNLAEQICDGNSYEIGPESFNTTGNYGVVLSSIDGCDSTVHLDLTVIAVTETELAQQICQGQSYSVGNEMFTTTGEYEVTLTALSGCDSVVMLNLEVLSVLETDLTESICEGQSYEVGTESFNVSGEYDVTLISSANCDSIVHLDLTVNPQPQTDVPASICEGETFEVGNESFDQTGQYEITLNTLAGCDSTVFLDLVVLENPEFSVAAQICAGESYTAGGEEFSTSGQYEVTVSATNGCDSIIQLDLDVLAAIQTDLAEQICEGNTFTVGTATFEQTGEYEVTLTALSGCDSVVYLDLEVLNFLQTDLNEIICEGETYEVGSESFDESGTYQVDLTAVSGCDSIVVLDLEVVAVAETPISATICDGDTYQVENEIFDETGNYEVLLTANSGCDSLVQLDLVVMAPIVENLAVEICQGGNYAVGNETFGQSGFYQIDLISADGCDSTVLLDLTVNLIVENLDVQICPGSSYMVGNETFDQDGQYQVDLTTPQGCDSVVLLNLEVTDFLQTDLTEQICEGEIFQVGSEVFGQAGLYQVDFVTAGGCDSIVFLDLSVAQLWQTDLVESICEGETYQVGNEIFDLAGIYQVVLSAVTGCDSTVWLNLEVMENQAIDLVEQICDGDSYTVGNEVFTQAGQYEVGLVSSNGCDSLVSLNLSVVNCNVLVDIQSDPVNCHGGNDGSIELLIANGQPPFQFQWVNLNNAAVFGNGVINALNAPESVIDLPAGNYEFSITDANGYFFQQIIEVVEPDPLSGNLTASQYNNFNLACHGDENGFLTASANGGAAPYQFDWDLGVQGADLQNIGAGTYEVTITDDHGCTHVLMETMEEPTALQWTLDITEPGCDNPTGAISVMDVSGGTPVYTFYLDGNSNGSNASFSSLSPGDFLLNVVDANGCELSDDLYLPPPPALEVSLGDDITIELGEQVRLAPIVVPVLPDTYLWEGEGLSCYDCFDPMAAPLETTLYTLFASTVDGCQAVDDVLVTVKKGRSVFIPNAFSPNGDGLNDELIVFAGRDVVKVKSFHVFSRWGETVFQYFNFPPNDFFYGWDGLHRGQMLQAGVFTYLAEVEFIDGFVQQFKGDVTLIR